MLHHLFGREVITIGFGEIKLTKLDGNALLYKMVKASYSYGNN
jgi:hypothetical protein